jgi:hypothetical protein
MHLVFPHKLPTTDNGIELLSRRQCCKQQLSYHAAWDRYAPNAPKESNKTSLYALTSGRSQGDIEHGRLAGRSCHIEGLGHAPLPKEHRSAQHYSCARSCLDCRSPGRKGGRPHHASRLCNSGGSHDVYTLEAVRLRDRECRLGLCCS